ncbi:hypothetical protein SAMN05216167_119132, partial [Spirosoma endophyticum]
MAGIWLSVGGPSGFWAGAITPQFTLFTIPFFISSDESQLINMPVFSQLTAAVSPLA